jgi:Fe-S-cluster containining protein
MTMYRTINQANLCPCGSGKAIAECHKKANAKWQYVGNNYLGEPIYSDPSLESAIKERLDKIEQRAYKVETKQEALDLLDEMYEVIAPGYNAISNQMSCRKGCAACCYQAIPSTALETARIKKFIANHERRDEWLKKINELKDHYPKAKGSSTFTELASPYFFEGRPCPFLSTEDNTCGIYPVRPQTCRSHMVVSDPQSCHAQTVVNVGMYHSQVYTEQTTKIVLILNAMIYPNKKPEFLIHLF